MSVRESPGEAPAKTAVPANTAAFTPPDMSAAGDLLFYPRTLWKRRWLVLGATLIGALLAGLLAWTMPDVYRAETLLAPANAEKDTGMSSAFGRLGRLTSLAGISPGGDGNTEEYLAVLRSRDFIWQFVRSHQLMPILFAGEQDPEADEQAQLWAAHRLFTGGGLLTTSRQGESGLVTVAVNWGDPVQAAAWANTLVDRLNEYLRQRELMRVERNLAYLHAEVARTQVVEIRLALFELISKEQKKAMLANTQKEFAFRVLDPAVTPDRPVKPNRPVMILLGGLLAGVAAMLLAFLLEGLGRHPDDGTSQS